MAAWEEDFDEMVAEAQKANAAEAKRIASLSPREQFKELIKRESRKFQNGRRSYAKLNAANRTRRARIMANYISRNPDYKSISALRATSKVPMSKLPENAMNTIRSMLYGPRRRGEGPVANIHKRMIRSKKIANATRRHFPSYLNKNRPRVRRTQSLNRERQKSKSKNRSKSQTRSRSL